MNASEDQTEPMGESPELTIPRVVPLMDRQTQALAEIRFHVDRTLSKPSSMTGYTNTLRAGEKAGAAVIASILERNGLT